MYLTDDPEADFNRWDADLNKRLSLLPKCDYCGKSIQDDYFYQIGTDSVCCDCLDKHFKQEVIPYE